MTAVALERRLLGPGHLTVVVAINVTAALCLFVEDRVRVIRRRQTRKRQIDDAIRVAW